MKTPKFWGLHAKPGLKLNWFLAAVPFIIIISMYLVVSDIRLEDNPKDKLMPSISSMIEEISDKAFTPNRKGNYVLLNDTKASISRLAMGVGLAAFVGLMLGMNTALFPGMRSTINPLITFLSIIPPLALLPILLITMGTGEVAKVTLIFIGVVFSITRDIYRQTKAIPKEQITKALSLGATELEVVYKIVLPQILPSLLNTVRLSLGAAWLFLIAGEAIAAKDGLGYSIYIAKRYMAMDVIIPYVLIITGLGFLMDYTLRKIVEWKYPWYVAIKEGE